MPDLSPSSPTSESFVQPAPRVEEVQSTSPGGGGSVSQIGSLANSSGKKNRSLKRGILLSVLIILGVVIFYLASLFRNQHPDSEKVIRYIHHGQYSQAASLIARLLDAYPTDPYFLLLAGKISRGLGEFENAEQFLDRYYLNHENDESYLLQRSMLRAAEGNLESTRSYLLTKLDQESESQIEILEVLVRGSLVSYQLLEAEKYFHLWEKVKPDDPKCYFLMGRFFELIDSTKQSIESYEKVLQFVPDHVDARTELIQQLCLANLFEESLNHCEILKKQNHYSSLIQVYHAQCLVNFGREPEAIELLDEVLRTNPTLSPALSQRAEIAMQNNEYLQAEKWLREAVNYQPNNTKARYQYILCLKRLGKEKEALQQNNRLTQITNDFQRMQEIATREMQNRPKDPALRYEVGMIAMRAGLAQEGARWMKTILDIAPNHIGAHEALAGYYQAIGKVGLASRHLDLAQQAKKSKE
jgi:tetratricopeptide (TPR) repeat protein